jgi:hypothetical protein
VGRARHDVRRCCAGSQFGFRILKPGERPSVDSGDLPKPKRADTKYMQRKRQSGFLVSRSPE